jgi:hypothetical protein
MDESALRRELQPYLALTEEQLLAALVEEDAAVAYSLKGRVARGRQIFGDLLQDLRHRVCASYKAHEKTTDNALDAAALVAGALLAVPDFANIPVLPLAAIVAKIGLPQFCAGQTR